jgi:pimeloyl-ACP methyl ester carboxylesterase
MMGSRLAKNGRVLWGESLWKMKDQFEKLALPWDGSDDGIDSVGLVEDLLIVGHFVRLKQYSRLLKHFESVGLKRDQNLFVFHYDWRRSAEDAARRLDRQIKIWKQQLQGPQTKFVIVAHSLGGLVAKYYIKQLGGDRSVTKLVLLGTPTEGALKSLLMFRGGLLDDDINRFLGEERVRRVIRTFPSAYELLPRYRDCCNEVQRDGSTSQLDIFDIMTWKRFRWIEFASAEASEGWHQVEKRLQAAQEFHHALDGVGAKVTIHKIVGYTQPTLREAVFNSAGAVAREVVTAGDETVTLKSASIGDLVQGDSETNVQRVSEKHGSLYTDPAAQRTIVELVRDHTRSNREDYYAALPPAADYLKRAIVTLDRTYYRPQDEMTLTVDVADSNAQPIPNVTVEAQLDGAAAGLRELASAVPGTARAYTLRVPQSPGAHEIIVRITSQTYPDTQVSEIFEVLEGQ